MAAGMFSLSQPSEGLELEDKRFEGYVTPAMEELRTLLTEKTHLELEVRFFIILKMNLL